MKTPEQMAEEYADSLNFFGEYRHIIRRGFKDAFLAGYQAAKDQLQPQPFHAGADVYIIDANNPLPKPMPLSIAEQVQFADAGKVMNSPNNSNGWISVKERLPKHDEQMLVVTTPPKREIYHVYWDATRCVFDLMEWGHLKPDEVSHWCYLPEAPKGEG